METGIKGASLLLLEAAIFANFFIFNAGASYQDSSAQCLAQVASVPDCIANDGSWKTDVVGLEFAKYGVAASCASVFKLYGLAQYNDSLHFNCGQNPTTIEIVHTDPALNNSVSRFFLLLIPAALIIVGYFLNSGGGFRARIFGAELRLGEFLILLGVLLAIVMVAMFITV